jgi:flagellar biosynthesis/type III secretory pathway protein FliH
MSRIVKGAAPSGGRIAAEALEAAERARAVVARAEADARAIRAAADAARDEVRAEAAREGRREALAGAAAALVEAAAARDGLLASAEREVAALGVEVARRLLRGALAVDPGAAVALAAGVVEAARAHRQVAVRVHPADAASLRAGAEQLRPLAARARALEIREDPALTPGDVVVETEAGRIDGRLETRLGLLARALEDGTP